MSNMKIGPVLENEIPIEQLRFYSDEKLCYCERFSVHSVRCPKNYKIPISMLPTEECNVCIESNQAVDSVELKSTNCPNKNNLGAETNS